MKKDLESPWQARREASCSSSSSNPTKQTHRLRVRPRNLLSKTVPNSPAPLPVEDISDVDSNATTLRDFAKHCHQIGLDQFLSVYPFHFLIQETLMSASAGSGIQGTVSDADTETSGPVDLFAALVYRLKKKGSDDGTPLTIGRSSKNDIYISNSRVSKTHATIENRDGNWFLTDCRSTNGTYLDGVELRPGRPYQLNVNSRICFSEEAAFRFLDNHRMCNHVKFFGHQQRD